MTGVPRGLSAREGVPLDLAPLTAPVDRAEVRAVTSRVLERDGVRPVPIIEAVVLAIAIPAVFVAAAVFLPISTGAVLDAVQTPDAVSIVVAIILSLLPIGAFAAAGALVARGMRTMIGRGARWVRLERFATANGLRFDPATRVATGPGMLVTAGRDATVRDAIIADVLDRGHGAAFARVSNLQYTIDLGRFEKTVRWGVIELRLGTSLPHIVLDAKGNDTAFGSTLPRRMSSDQRLSLGAEFDRRFTLYCPAGYETEALRLFTPDIMARFIDRAAACDVEIVDDRMLLYVRGGLVEADPVAWAWIDETVSALVDRVGRWERWRDERLAGDRTMQDAPSVAPGARLLRGPRGVTGAGRRLRSAVPWFVVAIGVIIVVVNVVSVIVDAISG
jgi:hypothetical protein